MSKVTTQKTGKIWKLQIMLAVLLMLGSGVMCFVLSQVPKTEANKNLLAVCILTLAFSLVWYLFAKFCAWWANG